MEKSLIVKSNIGEYAKVDGKRLNVSEDFYARLQEKVEILIKDACARATQNGRNTVMGKDL